MILNEYEIETAIAQHHPDSVAEKAARWLDAYRTIVNERSDGWGIWRSGTLAAAGLARIVRGEHPATDGELKKANASLKRFCTTHGLPQPKDE